MKPRLLLFLLVVFAIHAGAAPASPVEITTNSSASYSPAPGDVELSLRLIGGKGSVFMPGREINLTFQTSKDAYVIVYGIDSEGVVQLLFPNGGTTKKVPGNKVHFLPERDGGIKWLAGGRTGVEYIHAVAVTGANRIDSGELLRLARNAGAPEGDRLVIDSDPLLAFNMIDEALIKDAPDFPPATDYTWFYINKKVDYPRYLCSKCHGEGKISDPYAMECPEIYIERFEFENEDDLRYPYPALYAVRHVDEEDDYYASPGYTDDISGGWDDEDYYDDDDSKVYLSIYYTNYDYPYRFNYPAFRSWNYSYYDPWGWDYDPWGWGSYSTWGWDDYYYHRWPYQSWYAYRYDWYNWNCMYGYNYCYSGWWFSPWNHHDYYHDYYDYDNDRDRRSIYAGRSMTKRSMDYNSSAVRSSRTKTIADSRLGETKTAAASARRQERAKSTAGNIAARRSAPERSSLQGTENNTTRRRVIYGSDGRTGSSTGSGETRRSRAVDSAAPSSDSGTRRMYRETGKSSGAEKNSRSRIWKSRDADRSDPERERAVSPGKTRETETMRRESEPRKRTERVSTPERTVRKPETPSRETRGNGGNESVRKNNSSSNPSPSRSSSSQGNSGGRSGSSSTGRSGDSGRAKKR